MDFPNNTTSGANDTMPDLIPSSQESAAEIFGMICTKYIAPSICVFGIIGNSFSLVVLMRQSLKQSPYVNLKALTIVNLLALLISFPYMIHGENSRQYGWLWYNIYIFIPFVSSLTATSIWVVVLMTVERFMYVRFPLRAKRQCARTGTLVRIFVVLFLALLMSLHKFFQYRINPNKLQYVQTVFKASQVSHIIEITLMVINHFIPLIVLAIVNFLLVRTVRQARNRRVLLNLRNNQEGGWQKDERRFTVTLVSIVILNICFIGPATITDLLCLTIVSERSQSLLTTIIVMRQISNVLLWFCLSSNFVLYCTFNKKFLQAMKDTLQIHRFRKHRFKSVKFSEMTFLRSTNFDS
ncbi:probable G-protein coupled receptor B0563.6 [Ostrea edulis]|uniref:probable G-protein coupled receptor B0563.6 n=1 Tax=Ostrea edulis TaxID=37623 RepID=UPI0020960142|nr:probable G-protein coupled receptor B0563.6 [Ostrea edulis]